MLSACFLASRSGVASLDEITVLGSMAVLFTFQPAIELLRAGAVNVDALLTDAFGLDDFEKALETMRRGEGIKVQVLPNG